MFLDCLFVFGSIFLFDSMLPQFRKLHSVFASSTTILFYTDLNFVNILSFVVYLFIRLIYLDKIFQ